jgi:serine/threonine-protein kinase
VAHIGVQVAEALEYAANQGVLHRDIKPSNLLLDMWGSVWLTDFGLAKATGTPDLTRPGDLFGTLRYLAPERFQGQSDIRSDVYALGLTLYEALALRPAFDDRGQAELMHQINTVGPPRLDKLCPQIPRDLVTIAHKAMSKDPSDRYQTAGALAEDLSRFLDDRSIVARRPRLLEQAWRWCRRNPGMAAAVGVAIVALVAGTVVSLFFAVQAAGTAAAEKTARERAEKNFKRAQDAVDQYLTKVSDSPQLQAHGLERLRKELLGQAKAFYDDFVREQADEPGLQAERGRAYLRLADITAELGDRSGAIEYGHHAQQVFEQLCHEYPETVDYQDELAKALTSVGRNYFYMPDLDRAKASYEQALTLCERLAREAPQSPDVRFRLATIFNGLGRIYRREPRVAQQVVQTEAVFQKAQVLCEPLVRDHPEADHYRRELAQSLLGQARLRYESGRMAPAEAMYALALPLLEELARKDPGVPEDRFVLASALHDLAQLHGDMGRPHQRQAVCEKARSLFAQLFRDHPDVPEYRNGLAIIGVQLASAFSQLGEHTRAAATTEEALALAPQEGMALYNGACVYCGCAAVAKGDVRRSPAEREELVERYSRRAMELLKANAEGQYFKTPWKIHLVETDPDLNPLRDRDDFKRFHEELKSRSGNK